MGASNWAKCPRCTRRAEKSADTLDEVVKNQYGKVSAELYELGKKDAEEARRHVKEMDHTLREDYEIYGAEDGSVIVSYSGQCGICNLSLTFNHEETFNGVDD